MSSESINAENTDQASAEPKSITIAKLDANDVYWGTKTIPANELSDRDVQVPENCDLAAGAYRYERHHHGPGVGAFVSIEPVVAPVSDDIPAQNAIAVGFAALAIQGVPLPHLTRAWVQQHFGSIDAAGGFPANEDRSVMVEFLAKRKAGEL